MNSNRNQNSKIKALDRLNYNSLDCHTIRTIYYRLISSGFQTIIEDIFTKIIKGTSGYLGCSETGHTKLEIRTVRILLEEPIKSFVNYVNGFSLSFSLFPQVCLVYVEANRKSKRSTYSPPHKLGIFDEWPMDGMCFRCETGNPNAFQTKPISSGS